MYGLGRGFHATGGMAISPRLLTGLDDVRGLPIAADGADAAIWARLGAEVRPVTNGKQWLDVLEFSARKSSFSSLSRGGLGWTA